jgi:hypothetical protein
MDGERKSIEPMANRLPDGDVQALQFDMPLALLTICSRYLLFNAVFFLSSST